jgi:calcium-independent phospholipase A2-gamma
MQFAHTPHAPPIQPAVPAEAILSRTRETKILLSIDGDGVRGLSALLLIESLVNAICVKVGQRLDSHQIFDLTGGSSLGGVIAIMLCRLRMQAHRAREAYKQIAKQVYLNKRDYFISLDPHAQTSNVDGKELEREVKAVIQQELGNPDELLLDGRPDSGDV